MHYISVKLEESYIDKVNGTLTVEFYKNWSDKNSNYTRLLASIPSVPWYQARAIRYALETVRPQEAASNVLPFKLVKG